LSVLFLSKNPARHEIPSLTILLADRLSSVNV
jgi:hypothetical protein